MALPFDDARSGRRVPARRRNAWHFVLDALAARRQRQALTRLDDAALRDLGLTRADVAAEAAKRLWDVPAGWRR